MTRNHPPSKQIEPGKGLVLLVLGTGAWLALAGLGHGFWLLLTALERVA